MSSREKNTMKALPLLIATFGLATISARALGAGANPSATALDDMGVDLKSGNPIHVMGNVSLGPENSPDLQLGIFATHFFVSGKTPLYATVSRQCTTYGGVSGCIYQRLDWNLSGENHNQILTPPSRNVPLGFTEQGAMASNWTITTNDGTVWTFNGQFNFIIGNYGMEALVSSITYPTGEVLNYHYMANGELRSIVSTRGYMLHMEGYFPHMGKAPNKTQLINLSVDYCAPLAATCPGLTVNWPAVTYVQSSVNGLTTIQATDNIGRTTVREQKTTLVADTPGQDRLTAWFKYTAPGGSWFEYNRDITIYNLPGSDGLTCTARSLLRDFKTLAGTWTYTWTGQELCQFMGVTSGVSTAPDGNTQRWNGGAIVDGLGRRTTVGVANFNDFFGGGGLGIKSYIADEGNKIEYGHDWRQNSTLTLSTSKDGNTTISSSAEYPATCTAATAKYCNKPIYTIDGNGNRTDYTYYPQHGGVDTALLPPDDDGIRPRIKYTYEQKSARYRIGGGGLQNGPLIWVLSTAARCKTGATCAGSAEEVVTSYQYNDNLWPTTTTIKDGAGLIMSETTVGYDAVGNVTSVDGPAAGTVDKVYTFYDAARQVTGEIGVDPDGSGPLVRPARRFSFDIDGKITRIESGTATGTTSQALDAMVVRSYVETAYDNLGRAVRTTSVDDGIIQSVIQRSFNLRGRPVCSALRMNPAVYASLPLDACAHSQLGPNGPDRITKNIYDAAGQVVQVIRALGTPDQVVYATYRYSGNGEIVDLIDAEGKRTHFEYDGFDRLVATRYPSSIKPSAFDPSTLESALSTAGAYSSTDAEIFGYDANGNLTSARRRDGATIGLSYDKLNREIFRDLPNGDSNDVYTGYDLLSSVLFRRFSSKTGPGVTYVPDILGRVKSTTDMNGRTLGYLYNASSVRYRLTLPDANYIGYTLDNANRVTHAGWNSTAGLFSQSYNSLGQLVGIAKGGASTSYAFTASGRLTTLSHDFAGGGDDVSWSFPVHNAEGEVVSRASSNVQYEYRPLVSASTSQTYDGLNRIDAFVALPSGYDGRGNLKNDGVRSTAFDVENRLTSVTGGSANMQLTYDPEGRLASFTSNGVQTSLLYDGFELIGEYGPGGLQRTYVHGSLVDNPVVWLEGAGASSPRYFFANYQGSIVAYANNLGAKQATYKYGPYGEPKNLSNADSWELPRFGFTGQPTLSDAKLYYFRARVYDPMLGRFLQPDPLGTADDTNLYAYAGGDPINGRDPSGLSNCADPADPTCIETPASAEEVGPPKPKSDETRTLEEVVVTAHKNKVDTNGKSLPFKLKEERGFIVSPTDFLPVKTTPAGTVNCGGGKVVEKYKVQKPGVGEAGAHTHYNDMAEDTLGQVPGPGDHRMANASPTKAAFMLTSNHAFSMENIGGRYRVTVISGPPLTHAQKSQLISHMQVWEDPVAQAPGATEKQANCPKPASP
jgi:RHS repeat-associated protein